MGSPSEGENPVIVGNALQRFKTLKERWGVELTDLEWKKPPELIMVDAMDHRETWKRRTLDTQKPDLTEYELIETRKK